MRVLLLLFLCCLINLSSLQAQALYRAVPSEIFNGERKIKILKPRNYKSNKQKTYPLVLVLDGDYMFEPVSGMVDYLSFWDQMPEALVVGIKQNQSRYSDTQINPADGFPDRPAKKFMDFIQKELVPMLREEYRLAPFTVMVAKDVNANLASFFLMQRNVWIDAFISINPAYSSLIVKNLKDRISLQPKHNFYYVATIPGKNQRTYNEAVGNQVVDSLFTDNEFAHFEKAHFPDQDEYGVVAKAIPDGLQFVFRDYRLLDAEELIADVEETNSSADEVDEDGVALEEEERDLVNIVDKLQEKYDRIEEIYGIEMEIRIVDIVNLADTLEENERWQELMDLAYIAEDIYPDLNVGYYYEALANEGMKNKNRAIDAYKIAYEKEPSGGISKKAIYDRVNLLSESGN